MDAIIKQLQDSLEGTIDFDGQRLADLLSTGLQSLVTLIALITGFVLQDIHLTLWIGLAGVLLAMLIVVPPWPFFNQNPQPWVGTISKSLPAGGIVIGKKLR